MKIALIAHDKKKDEIIKLAIEYKDVLKEHELYATGTTGTLIMGDFNYLNIRDTWELTVTFGWENDDFTKNLVTMIGEKRLVPYIKAQYKTAFVKDTIGNVVTAITKS